jgi:hypothetical protein
MKPPDEFRGHHHWDGPRSWCRECEREDSRERMRRLRAGRKDELGKIRRLFTGNTPMDQAFDEAEAEATETDDEPQYVPVSMKTLLRIGKEIIAKDGWSRAGIQAAVVGEDEDSGFGILVLLKPGRFSVGLDGDGVISYVDHSREDTPYVDIPADVLSMVMILVNGLDEYSTRYGDEVYSVSGRADLEGD